MKEFLFSIPVTSLGDGEKFYYNVVTKYLEKGEGNLICRIDRDGLDHSVETLMEISARSVTDTIKINGVERFEQIKEGLRTITNHCSEFVADYDYVSAHLFKAGQRAGTFKLHTDPVDLVIWCIDGMKTMEVNGVIYNIGINQCLFIPANAPHRAINNCSSIMLSVGFESNEQ